MNLRHPSLALAALLTGASVLAGCTATGGAKGSQSPVAPAASVSVETPVGSATPSEPAAPVAPAASPSEAEASPSEAASPADSMSPSPSITLGMPAPAPSPGDQASPAAGGQPVSTASATPGLVPSATTPSPLSLGTAFHSDGWTAGEYQAAGSAAKAPAFAATINCDAPPAELEYRFAPSTGSLALGFAQDVLSPSSENTVTFKVLTDGKAVAEKAVTFKQPGTVSVPLSGVTVVKIQAQAKGACTTSSTALVTKAVVEG